MQRKIYELQSRIHEKDLRIHEKDLRIHEKDLRIHEKDLRIAEKDRTIEALRIRKEELLRIPEIRAKADAAWERAIAERTGGSVRTKGRGTANP